MSQNLFWPPFLNRNHFFFFKFCFKCKCIHVFLLWAEFHSKIPLGKWFLNKKWFLKILVTWLFFAKRKFVFGRLLKRNNFWMFFLLFFFFVQVSYRNFYSALNFHESIGHVGTDGIRICNLSAPKASTVSIELTWLAIQERLKLELILFLNIYSLGGYWKWKWPDQQLGGAQKLM